MKVYFIFIVTTVQLLFAVRHLIRDFWWAWSVLIRHWRLGDCQFSALNFVFTGRFFLFLRHVCQQ